VTRERLYLFDTTLRDGQQTPGVDFSLDDKLVVMEMLDQLGLDYIEGGYPGANPTDSALFAEARPTKATFHRFRHGETRRPVGVQRSGPAGHPARQGQGDLLRRQILGTITSAWRCRRRMRKTSSPSRIRSKAPRRRAARCCSIASISSTASRPIRAYALEVAKTAYRAGARWVVLCDTNGGTLPPEVSEIVVR
jgi:2-isopropylmalate synthase